MCIFPGSMRIQPSLLASVRADHLTLDGGGGEWVILKKNFPQALVGRKKCVHHKCSRMLMGKKGEKISCPPDC